MEAASSNSKNNTEQAIEQLLGNNSKKQPSISSDILSFNSTSDNIKDFSKLPSLDNNENSNRKNEKDFSPNTSSNIFSPNTKRKINYIQKKKTEEKNIVENIVADFSKDKKCEVLTLSTLEKNSVSKIKAKLITYAS